MELVMRQKMDWKEGSSAKRRRVVVIGGCVGGSLVAKSLQFCADVTLVDLKEYFEIPWASWRSMVKPMFGDRSLINHRDYLPDARVVASKSIKITESEVSTADGRLFAYDYLVIATGHQDPVPTTKTERLKQFEADNQKIKSARSILIIGGGLVGVELAAEIAIDSPGRKDHPRSRRIEVDRIHWTDGFGENSKLVKDKERGCEIGPAGRLEFLIGWNVQNFPRRNYQSRLPFFLCTGKPLASSWLEETFLKGNLDRFGRLKVDRCMRVKGRDKIFAVGDITDVREIKQGCLAKKHAAVAVKNLKLLMDGGEERKMAVYEPRSVKAVVSLGRREALARFSLTTIIGRIPGAIKSKDLFIGKTRKTMGLKPDIAYS